MVETEFTASCAGLLAVVDRRELLDDKPYLQRSIQLRNPYIDPMHYVQAPSAAPAAAARARGRPRELEPPAAAQRERDRRGPAQHGLAMADERYERGLEVLRDIDPDMAEQLREKLGDLAPDLERMVVAFGFGDVYGRPGLGLREREIATVAALTALGTAERSCGCTCGRR